MFLENDLHTHAHAHAQQAGGATAPVVKKLVFASSCYLPTTWIPLRFLARHPVNHDTHFFDFELPAGKQLNLPVCACLLLCAPGREHGGGDAVRPYTPVSPPGMKGKFRLIVKVLLLFISLTLVDKVCVCT